MANSNYKPEHESLSDKFELIESVTNGGLSNYDTLLDALNIACKAIKCLDAETLQTVFNIKKPE